MEENLEKICWNTLSYNPNAIHLLEHHLEKINWYFLSGNPNAIPLLEKNPEKINWSRLSCNPNASHLLKMNPEKINWYYLSSNPNIMNIICEIDYYSMLKSMQPLAEELAMKVFNPCRLMKVAEEYNILFDKLVDVY